MNSNKETRFKKNGISVWAESVRDSSFRWIKGIEVIYILNGVVNVQIHKDPEKLTEIRLCNNQIYLVGNEEIHRIYSHEKNVILRMHIEYDRVKELFKGASYLEFDIPEMTASDKEARELKKLKDWTLEITNIVIGTGGGEDFSGISAEYIKWIIEKFEIVARKLARSGLNKVYYDRLLRATDYIQENFANRNVLKQIADTQYMNPAYISHDLKIKVDYNYRQLINFYRVGYAIMLLLESNYNVSEISIECGFSANRYFYKEFKKFYKNGPTKFRKKHKNSNAEVEVLDVVAELAAFNRHKESDISYKLNDYDSEIMTDREMHDMIMFGQKFFLVDNEDQIIGIAFVDENK